MSEGPPRAFVDSGYIEERRVYAPIPRDVQLPRCNTCHIHYQFYSCACYIEHYPVWAANEASCKTCITSEYRDGQAEPTTIPEITANLEAIFCGKFNCGERRENLCQNTGAGGRCKTTISVYACADIKIDTPHLCIWCNSTYAPTRPEIVLKLHTGVTGVCENYSQHEHDRRERERGRGREAIMRWSTLIDASIEADRQARLTRLRECKRQRRARGK